MTSQAALNIEIRSRLALAIEARSLSPRAVSIQAGFSPTYVGNMLRQGVGPSTNRIIHLSRVLKIDFEWLITGKGMMVREDRFQSRIATEIIRGIEAKRTGLEEVSAYVRDALAPSEVTDDEIQAAAQMIAAAFEERDCLAAAKANGGGQ